MGAGAAAAALVGFAATLCTVGYLQMTTVDYWALFPPDPGPWCERDHPHSFLREPSNALSDFGYLAVGLAILVQVAQSRGRPYGRFSAFPEVGILAGVSNILHACGTFTNHACRCYMGHVWDVAGMYAAVWYLVCLCAGRFMYARLISQANPSSEGLIGAITQLRKMFVLLYVGGCMLWYSLSQLRYTDPRCHPRENLIVTSMIVVSASFQIALSSKYADVYSTSNGLFAAAMGMVALGKLAQEADINKFVCWPDSVLQGHAVWHVATAIAIYLVWVMAEADTCKYWLKAV